MSATTSPFLILLVPPAQPESLPPTLAAQADVFVLTKDSAEAALEKIFQAERIAVWSELWDQSRS